MHTPLEQGAHYLVSGILLMSAVLVWVQLADEDSGWQRVMFSGRVRCTPMNRVRAKSLVYAPKRNRGATGFAKVCRDCSFKSFPTYIHHCRFSPEESRGEPGDDGRSCSQLNGSVAYAYSAGCLSNCIGSR